MTSQTFELTDAAEIEFYNAVDYYKQFDPALSSDFIQEFDRAVQRLLDFSLAGSPYIYGTKNESFSSVFLILSFIRSIGIKRLLLKQSCI